MRKGFFTKGKKLFRRCEEKMKKSEKDTNRAIQHNGGYVSGNRGASRINGLKGLSSKRLSSFVLTAISVVSVFVTVALLMTGTVEAQVAPNPTFVTVNVSPLNPPTIPADQITIRWVHEPTIGAKSGNDVIHVTTTAATPDYAMVGVPTDFILQNNTQISYWGYTASNSSVNAPDEIFLFLDTDNNGEVDVILGNHWGPSGTGSWQQWDMTKGIWFTVDPRTGVTSPANISDYCDKGYKVLGVAIGAGSPESYPTGVTVNVYLDNLTIDVDGDGNPEYTLDDDTGTIEVFCETINGTTYCASIQDAIDAALPGDTILVHDGTYSENVVVNKSLTVQAASSPVLDGTEIGGIGVKIEASNVNLTGFIIQNYDTGVQIKSGTNVSIIGNDILNNDPDTGILVKDGAAAGNEAHFNNIVGNDIGVKNEDPNDTFDAGNNWWGDVSGPSGVGYGTGDKVSANVDYDPWLDAPYPGGHPINFTGAQTTTTGTGTTEIDAKVNASTTVSINTTAPVNVTIAEYLRNPGSGFSGDIGKYIDVHVDNTTNVTNITIKLFYTDADIVGLNENTLRMLWWNDATGEWVACSNTGVNTTDQNGYSGYIWAYIDQTTIPSLSDLTGAPFGGQGSSPERVPVLTPIGLLTLIGILNVVLAVATMRRKKSK